MAAQGAILLPVQSMYSNQAYPASHVRMLKKEAMPQLHKQGDTHG
jgi:hypothetical protein